MRSFRSALLTFLFVVQSSLLLASSPDVAMSAWIADIKFSKEGGVKICEVQPVTRSRFRGSDFAHGEDGYVAHQLVPVLANNFTYIWYRPQSHCDPFIVSALKEHGAIPFKSLAELERDPVFRRIAAVKPTHPEALKGYRGLVWARDTDLDGLAAFQKRYPGVLVMDAGIWKKASSKAEMNALFRSDKVLKQFKPRCAKYERKYTSTLADTIIKDVKADLFVIKPLNSTKGQGVLIVPKSKLNSTLKTILTKNEALRTHKDPEMRFWYSTKSKLFVVEEFAESDPIKVAHLRGKEYDGTMRAVFLLSYNKGEVDFQLIDTYWKLPKLALSEDGTITEKHKSFGEEPHFAAVASKTEQKVEEGLAEGMPRLYEILLDL